MNITKFINEDKALLIAPAGYGKTYTLAQCLEYTEENKRQLILTHTHAGIASIKEKVNERKIPSHKYHIETITGFAQRYVLALSAEKLEVQQGHRDYYSVLVDKSVELLRADAVKRIITESYAGLFVDEYQDCTNGQHQMIMLLAELLPTRLFGDSMQGIFGFHEGGLVDFDLELADFIRYELETPWRWRTDGNNRALGEELKEIRKILESESRVINLSELKEVELHNTYDVSFYENLDMHRFLRRIDRQALNNSHNVLVITPDSPSYVKIKRRIDIQNTLKGRYRILESFDEGEYYKISKLMDSLIGDIECMSNPQQKFVKEILKELYYKGCVNDWFNESGGVKNRKMENRIKSKELESIVAQTFDSPDTIGLINILDFCTSELKFNVSRRDLLYGINQALQDAHKDKSTVYDAMVQQKNVKRRMGRHILGCSIGTTLLTKGFEFDTVVILDAHLFECYKHFYVAVTRACKRLIVYSDNHLLSFSDKKERKKTKNKKPKVTKHDGFHGSLFDNDEAWLLNTV